MSDNNECLTAEFDPNKSEWLTAEFGSSQFIYSSDEKIQNVSKPGSPMRFSQVEALRDAPLLAGDTTGCLRRSFRTRGNMLIGIGGGIAARKTTVGLSLKEVGRDFFQFYPEPASHGNEMLSFFYANPDLFAEPMQFNAIRLRFGITLRVMEDMKAFKEQDKAALFCVERMWPWDWSFMRANFYMGRFREKDRNGLELPESEALRDYENLMKDAWDSIFVANLMVFIEISPEESFERIQARARGCEIRIDPKCYKCTGAADPGYCAEDPGMVSTICSQCGASFVSEDGPVPLKYLKFLHEADSELQREIIARGYRFSVVRGSDNLAPQEVLDIIDMFTDDRTVDDYDKQIDALKVLEQKALALYEKYLGRIGYTREAILEGHRKYIEKERLRTGGKVDES